MALLTPHFDLPFRLVGNSFGCVEQNSYEDVANCVEAIIRTPREFREDADEFGITDIEFSEMPVPLNSIAQEIMEQEPRAVVVLAQNGTSLDQLVEDIKVRIDV